MNEKQSFQVWRQDDNGHQFLIETCASRQEAEELIARLSAGFHKQTYWIKAIHETCSPDS